MKLKLLSSLSLSLLATLHTSRAQPAEEFFHAGAQSYLSNNIPSALEKVESGLKLYPYDVKLKKLEELLKQQQQQQSKQDQQQQKDQQQQQNQQKDQQSEQDKQKQEQQQAQNQDQQKQQEQQQQNQKGQKENEQSGDQDQSQAYAPGQMTPQEAQQLLDAQKGDEMLLPVKPEQKAARSERKLRDW